MATVGQAVATVRRYRSEEFGSVGGGSEPCYVCWGPGGLPDRRQEQREAGSCVLSWMGSLGPKGGVYHVLGPCAHCGPNDRMLWVKMRAPQKDTLEP